MELEQLNSIIKQGVPQPSHFVLRANAFSQLRQFDEAAKDMAHAIELEPDNASYYWLRGGYLLSHEVDNKGQIGGEGNDAPTSQILEDYKLALERDPTDGAAWINLIEINVLLRRWDDAIACFGASRKYMTFPSYQVIRSFLGCLALALVGDDISDEDRSALDDMDIAVSHGLYRFSEVEEMIQKLTEEQYEQTRLSKALSIYRLFLGHF